MRPDQVPVSPTFGAWLRMVNGEKVWADALAQRNFALRARITRLFVTHHPGRRRVDVLVGLPGLV